MYKTEWADSSSIVNSLVQLKNQCEYRILDADKNDALIANMTTKVKQAEQIIEVIKVSAAYTKQVIKTLEKYNAEQKEKTLDGIHAGIATIKQILPETEEVRLIISGNEVYLADEDGSLIELMEGSGFRALLSMFIRTIILKNTRYMKTVFFDEPLATLDLENSSLLSAFLPSLAKDMQIILIEQKPQVFSNAEKAMFSFRKIEGVTRVTDMGVS